MIISPGYYPLGIKVFSLFFSAIIISMEPIFTISIELTYESKGMTRIFHVFFPEMKQYKMMEKKEKKYKMNIVRTYTIGAYASMCPLMNLWTHVTQSKIFYNNNNNKTYFQVQSIKNIIFIFKYSHFCYAFCKLITNVRDVCYDY